MTAQPQPRYAIYYAPPENSVLDRFGSRWLGRDAWTDTPTPQPEVPGLAPERVAALTAAPRRYGFHATLKAPFALSDGETRASLETAVAAFAAGQPPVLAGSLGVADFRGFLALTLEGPTEGVHGLADACVRVFQPFARPLGSAEVHRRGDGLSARQRAHLERWNYPFVFEDFRFHMTLSDRTEPGERARLAEAVAQEAGAALDEPVEIDALTLFVEEKPGANLRIAARFPLTGTPSQSY